MIETQSSMYSVNQGVKGNTYEESLAAISPCFVLLLSHGIHLIWTLTTIVNDPTSSNYKTATLSHPELVYYSGAIVGAIFAARIVSTTPKKTIYTIAAILTLCVGVLYLLSKYDSAILFIGLFLAGSCYGITILTALIHASEIASHEDVRHKVILALGMALVLSFVVPAMILKPSYNVEFARTAIGAMCLIQGGCVLLTNIFCMKESPSFILQNSNIDIEEAESKNEAFSSFKINQDGIASNPELLSRFSALESYVAEEKCRSRNIFEDGNGISLLACIAIRFFRVLTFKFYTIYSMAIEQTEVKEDAEWIVFRLKTPASNNVFFYFVFGSMATCAIYSYKKQVHGIATGFIFVSIIGAVLKQICNYLQIEISKINALHFLCFMLLVYCLSIPLDLYGMIHLSEAFQLSKKPYSIGFVLVVEYLTLFPYSWLHSIDQDFAKWFIIVGGFVFGVITLCYIPPETKNLTLEQCPAAYENAFETNEERADAEAIEKKQKKEIRKGKEKSSRMNKK